MTTPIATVLVVDDDGLLRAITRAMLERNNFAVCEAADGEAAIKSLATHPVDIALVDILMPRKDGLETIIDLKRDFPAVKVYAMSASRHTGQDFLSVAAKFGADGVLRKPFAENDLLTLVRSGASSQAVATEHASGL